MQSRIPRTNTQRKGNSAYPLSCPAYFAAQYETTHSPRTTDRTRTHFWNASHVTPAQNRRIAHKKSARVTLYADMLKVDYPPELNGKKPDDYTHRGGGKRGTVTGFSRASRKRMIEFMARVRHDGNMLFLTMTYDDGSLQREDFDMKAEFEMFRKRFERAFPSWGALWRVEMMKRKSGDLSGIDVPHYHMLVFVGETHDSPTVEQISQSFRSWGAIVWQEITGSFDPYHLEYGFHCTPVKSRKHAYHYVSKYVGKQASDEHEVGRRWGRIGHIDVSPSEEFRMHPDEIVIFRRLIKKWLKNRANQRRKAWLANPRNKGKNYPISSTDYAKRFARSDGIAGFTVFGLGDNCNSPSTIDLFPPGIQFLYEAKRQYSAILEQGRGHGD